MPDKKEELLKILYEISDVWAEVVCDVYGRAAERDLQDEIYFLYCDGCKLIEDARDKIDKFQASSIQNGES